MVKKKIYTDREPGFSYLPKPQLTFIDPPFFNKGGGGAAAIPKPPLPPYLRQIKPSKPPSYPPLKFQKTPQTPLDPPAKKQILLPNPLEIAKNPLNPPYPLIKVDDSAPQLH